MIRGLSLRPKFFLPLLGLRLPLYDTPNQGRRRSDRFPFLQGIGGKLELSNQKLYSARHFMRRSKREGEPPGEPGRLLAQQER